MAKLGLCREEVEPESPILLLELTATAILPIPWRRRRGRLGARITALSVLRRGRGLGRDWPVGEEGASLPRWQVGYWETTGTVDPATLLAAAQHRRSGAD